MPLIGMGNHDEVSIFQAKTPTYSVAIRLFRVPVVF
jgi:hypothetical protein